MSKAKAVIQVTGDQHYIPHVYVGSTLRPNARTQLAWSYGTETVLTNARGWRVGDNDAGSFDADVLAVGCSWGMGVGSNFSDTISANLERVCGIPIGNASVGSFSLLQMVRRVEVSLREAKPRLVVLLYGHWQLDRCFKRNAYADIVERPIFMRNASGDLIIREPPAYASLLVQAYLTLYRNLRSGRPIAGGAKLLKLLKVACTITGIRIDDIRRILSGNRHAWISSKESNWNDRRVYALRYCLTELMRLARAHDAKILLQHMYEYVHLGTPQWGVGESDRVLIRSLLQDLDPLGEHIVYRDWASQEQVFSHYLEANHCRITDLVHAENFHPTGVGYRLIAEGMAPFIRELLEKK